ncbi:MAG TPA: glycosyltransferase family 39 protein, partial [Solirubrobacteraceae bacterium]|nr:glycosyltransferase family 39 protein [Solirubrobacteraceae bacterium]
MSAQAPEAPPHAAAPAPTWLPTRRTAGLLLGAILLGALALRLWHIRHGLPFAYNADEAEHFVPKAVGMFDGGLNPGYYENPPGLTYLFYVLFSIRFSADGHFARSFAADPEPAFVLARVAVALIGTLVVGLVHWAGARFYDRRVGLVAAALMAVAFLPVFYSKHALNDVVTLAPITVALVACLLIYQRGAWADWALAGGAIGVAGATKYTAAAMLLCVAVAAGLRVEDRRSELRRALIGLAIAGAACAVMFALLNPYAILNAAEARDQITSQSSQADTAKLGQDDTYGWLYYVGTLTWGFGWLPLLAAVAGAVLAIRRDWRIALLLVAFPVCFYLYMGSQGRFFGRWLLPMYPALCVLAAYAVVTIGARRAALVAGLTALLCAQGVLASVHVDTVLGREDTRAQALAWVDANVPAGAPVVLEPFVPAAYGDALDRPVWPVERPFQAYEKRLRVPRIDRYREGGYCWVIVGSTQKERGLKAGLASSRNYYRALDAASEQTVRFSPYARGADPVEFSYDSSFNYRP